MVSWDSLNPILSLSEWFGERARASKQLKRALNNDLPPLLQQPPGNKREYSDTKAQPAATTENEDTDGFVHIHPKSFSTFSSRRNNRKPVHVESQQKDRERVSRRSSVIMPNLDKGGLYILSNESRKRKRNEDVVAGAANERYNSRPFVQRKREDAGVPGTVDIMVRIANAFVLLRSPY